MYFHKWDFHKAQSDSRTSLQTALGIELHFKKWASWFTQVPVLQRLPPAAEQEGAAGPHEGWSGRWGQYRVFLAKGSLSTWETRSPKKSYMFFSSNTGTNSLLKTASQILWSLQWITRLKVDLHCEVRSPGKATLAALVLAPGCCWK